MNNNKQYDIFISYRRDNGEDKARTLTQHLSALGYRVFFDHEAGMTGEFETEILAAVEIAPVFLMLLTPNCFDRCVEEGDWVRREIELAFKSSSCIIPIRPNYDMSMFNSLSKGIPDCVLRLKDLQFGEVDFHANFKPTVDSMVDTMIKKVVQPTLVVTETDKNGAKIHFFSDISCRVLHYGTPIAVTDAADRTTGAVAHLLKGRHLLEYKSIENEEDAYDETYTVVDNDYEDFVNIVLQPIKDKRRKMEEALREETEKKAEEEKERRNAEMQGETENDGYDYDLYFCYSRKDAHVVRTVAYYLKHAGYRCWIDEEGILSGSAFLSMIGDAIKRSNCMLVFLSKNSTASEWVMRELDYAMGMGKKVLPILLDDTTIPSQLSHLQYFDLRKQEYMSVLLKVMRRFLDRMDISGQEALDDFPED